MLLVVYVFAFAGILGIVNTFYFNFEKLADLIGGLAIMLLISGFLVYVFWVGLKTIFSDRGKK